MTRDAHNLQTLRPSGFGGVGSRRHLTLRELTVDVDQGFQQCRVGVGQCFHGALVDPNPSDIL